jgi:hypothetical protein
MQDNDRIREKVYLWQNKAAGEQELVRVGVIELEDWRQAQQQLNTVLRYCMRPEIPRGTGKLASLGDVSFVGREADSDIPAAIFFTRGNVCVTASSVGEKSVDVSEIALGLDHALNGLGEKRTLLKIRSLRSRAPIHKAIKVKARETKTVMEYLPREAPEGVWLKVVAPDGELRRTGNALVYVSLKSGKKSIATYTFSRA